MSFQESQEIGSGSDLLGSLSLERSSSAVLSKKTASAAESDERVSVQELLKRSSM